MYLYLLLGYGGVESLPPLSWSSVQQMSGVASEGRAIVMLRKQTNTT